MRVCDQHLAILYHQRCGSCGEYCGRPYEDVLYRCHWLDGEWKISGWQKYLGPPDSLEWDHSVSGH